MNEAAFNSFKLCPYNPDGYGKQISVLVVFYSHSQKKNPFLMETLAHPRIIYIFTVVASSLLIGKKRNYKTKLQKVFHLYITNI